MNATAAVTLSVFIGTGSKYETKDINGVSHFLEHLFFKGSAKRPNPGDVSRALDQMGAQHNAFTSKEITGYWVKTAVKHFDTALDVIADILLNPLFKSEEIDKERGVIAQEISMFEDMPMRKIGDIWEELIYGRQPAGWSITGTHENIKNITRNAIIKYRDSQYVASNTIAVVAGNIGIEDAFKKVKDALSGFKPGRAKGKIAVFEKQSRPQVRAVSKKTDQTHFILGFRNGYDMYSEKRHASDLLGVILGGNSSSRFFHEIREKRGLAYYVRAESEHYTDSGYLAGSAGVNNGALEEAVGIMLREFRDIAKNGPTEDEIKFAKDNLRGSLAISFESSDELAGYYGERELFHKKLVTPEEMFKHIENVSRDDIVKIASDMIRPRNLNLAVIGERPNTSSLQKILAGALK
ncbi:MAG: pitrilysin family protein [Patescibacteria group bacterium]